MRRLLVVMAVAAAFFALLAATDGVWPWLITFVALMVAAHVAGNSLGTRLRDTSADVRRWRGAQFPGGIDDPAATPQPVDWAALALPEPTPLRLHQPPPPRRVHAAAALGAVVGAAGGAFALAHLAGDRAGWPGLAVGAISCGVMGAWLSLLATSFWLIARQAWKHALRKS